MQIFVLTDEVIEKEFRSKNLTANIQVTFAEKLSDIPEGSSADVFFILKEGIKKENFEIIINKPVFINATIDTLKELDLPENFSRINGWPTFVCREIWEIATKNNEIVKDIFEKLGWKYITVADEPGLVAARIISMIINEAYFALGEKVSSKDEIDLAMKLGTNYPYGPFEWSRKIGLDKIYQLLERLSKTDSRYTLAQAMLNEISNS